MIRDETCTLCPLSSGLSDSQVCETFRGSADARVLVVTKHPLSGRPLEEMKEYMLAAGFDLDDIAFTGVAKCRNFDRAPRKSDLKTCASTYLTQEIEKIKPEWILALGNEALTATTGKAQVTKYRTKTFTTQGVKVFPTISPSAVRRNPGQAAGFEADLRLFKRTVFGEKLNQYKPQKFTVCLNGDRLTALMKELSVCEGYAFDLETNGFNEYTEDSKIVSLAITTWREGRTDMAVWVVPLYHRSSPFKNSWKLILGSLAPSLKMPRKRVAHNGKFDLRWLNEFGVDIDLTFDTMLAAHLLNENRPKGLKPLAQAILGVPAWDINTKDLLSEPLGPTLKYNGLDTWYTAHLYFKLVDQLAEQPRLYQLMGRIMVPASNAFTEIERRGIWVSREKLQTNAKIAKDTLDEIDERLMRYVPDSSVWPENIKEVNFNASNFARWWLFDYLELPVLARGKAKEDGTPGNPSMAEGVMQKLQKYNPHPVIDLLLERTKWQKYHSAFFTAYLEQIDSRDRIHTTFKLTGTVTGRLSSGKGDEEKVTGRVQNRGVNLQQVPRDPFVKGIFGGGPDSVFLECDYSQVELRVAAFLARERTMISLYQNEQDIHMATAMQMTGKPASQVTKEERKKAKPVNFGFLYGMSAATFITTAWNNYGVEVTEDESRAFRKAFFEQFPDLLTWHRRQKALAHKYKRVESPIGRVRHLPDIDSPDKAIRASAERQAINSPVQSFASDMAIGALVTLTREFRKRGLKSRSVGTVHDAINFEVPISELEEVAPLIKYHMENVPFDKWFGLEMDMPIIGDVALSPESWGEKEEIEASILTNPRSFRAWLKERGMA